MASNRSFRDVPHGIATEYALQPSVEEIKKIIHHLSVQLIAPCRYCAHICEDVNEKMPISCLNEALCCRQQADVADVAVQVSVLTCLNCGEFRKRPPEPLASPTGTEEYSKNAPPVHMNMT